MGGRACLCGAVGCRKHGRRPSRSAALYGADHQERVRRMLRSTPEICAVCGEGPRDGDPWEGGHIVDAVRGGGPELQREHRSCNRRKGAQTAIERKREAAERRAQQRIEETRRYLQGVG